MDRYQLAAARGMLGWSLRELSEKTNITVEAINKFERGEIETPRKSTLQAMREAFENEGIEFTDQSGIRKRNQSVNVGTGTQALENLFNKIYEYTVQSHGDVELLCSGFNAQDAKKYLSMEFDQLHRARMASFNKKVIFKTLISASDNDPDTVIYSEYKKLPDEYFFSAPFYIFGDTLAIITWGNPAQIITIKDKNVAEIYRRQFYAMWKLAS